ncbi:hypothetical protein ACFX5Q_34260 [Mesorhizobium sp. IMUNJ 23033]|uniref:hypothetical protein n=1 Tax=Mesorhizobium sp. IMUNJ 23033 TaxID=3378039 RepID=UPI00384A91DA
MENVIPFPYAVAPVQPVGHFIRLGESGYNKLADLHAAGRFPATRLVVDASRIKHQRELISALRAGGAEFVLDTKVAELSVLEKFAGYARHAPWSAMGQSRPLAPEHFDPQHAGDIFGQIARMAVEYGMDAVLAPSHFLGDPTFAGWFKIDRASCLALRNALDREGGNHIAVDYQLIVPHTKLNEDVTRSEILDGLHDLAYDNLWIRASGFGHSSGPLATRRFISALTGLHNLGKPIVADYLGGLNGHAALAFGAISGLCHGIGEKESFDARSWHLPVEKSEDGNFGRATRVQISGIDRSATVPELELMASAYGARQLVTCCDRACCAHGLKSTLADPRQHAAYQSFTMIAELASVPDHNRAGHFLNGRMVEVDRKARQVKDLKFDVAKAAERNIDVAKLTKRLTDHSKQIGKMRLTLEDLHESRADGAPRARPITQRGNGQRLGIAGSR